MSHNRCGLLKTWDKCGSRAGTGTMRAIAFGVFLAFFISAVHGQQSPNDKRQTKCQNTGTSCILRCKDDATCEDLCRNDYTICKAGGGSPYKTGTFIQANQQYTPAQKPSVESKVTEQSSTQGPHKYRPPLTPQQIAHPSNIYEQFHVALSAYDDDLVRVAMVRFSYDSKRLEWLEKAQQQRDANEINRTKPLIYPVR